MSRLKKKLELGMTKAWQQDAFWLGALAPVSALYGVLTQRHKLRYTTGKRKIYRAPVPVLVIGNITMGGSGKTPLIIALIKHLHTKGVRVGVISRGYGRQVRDGAMLVTAQSTPKMVGDEPCLIMQSTGAPMAVATKRSDAVELLMAYHPNIQMILADDGLQHHALYRDAEWIVVDAMRGFGNGKLFPQGFLREPLTRLEGATVIYHDRQSDYQSPDALRMALVPSAVRPLLGNVELDNPDGEIGDDTGGNTQTLKPQKVYAVTGIGHPTRFFDTLRGLDFDVIEVPFGDHHAFVIDDLTPLGDLPIITTSKDAVKLRELAHSLTSDKADTVHNPNQYSDVLFANIWELPVTAVLSQAVYAKLDQLLADFDISTDQNPSGA